MMEFTIIALISLAALGGVAYVFNRYGRREGEADDEIRIAPGDCATCSVTLGKSATSATDSSTSSRLDTPFPQRKCEQECMMEAAVKPIEYFDDEELDAYKGRPSDQYTDDEAEEFAYILHTMRPDEVAAWTRSLTLRGINPPDQLKDELLLLLGA